MEQGQREIKDILFKPVAGTVLAVISGLLFYVLCMMLSLVGPAGSRTEHAGKNETAFVAVLLLTLAMAGLATWSKMGCRKQYGGSMPWFSLGLITVCILTLLVLAVGGFKI